jgi:heptosyltransferase II
MKRILIIKLGYSETLDSMLSLTTSLGDVLRTTVILHFFAKDQVDWLVDEKAAPLLAGNKYISTVWSYNPSVLDALRLISYDTVINFEKMPDICRFAASLNTKHFYGFLYNGSGYEMRAQDRNNSPGKLVELSMDLSKKKQNKDHWQKILCDAIERKWNGQRYILGYQPKSLVSCDVGFNWATSSKWMNKSWPMSHWKKLEQLLSAKYTVTWQRGLNSLYEYIDWINSCRLVVTSDSLGLHICLALNKNVVALFGPTSVAEIYLYDSGIALSPDSSYKCIPCLKPVCGKQKQCMAFISPERVYENIEARLSAVARSGNL